MNLTAAPGVDIDAIHRPRMSSLKISGPNFTQQEMPDARDATAAIRFGGEQYVVSVVMVTPDVAKHWLTKNTKNRPISKTTVAVYVAALQHGEWSLNGETIIFDRHDCLIQGQHRLTAVVQSGVDMPVFVVRGVSTEAFATLDAGKRRSVGDVLSLSGEKNSNTLASALRAIVRMTEGNKARNFATAPKLAAVLEQYPEARYWAYRFAGTALHSFLPSAFIGVCTMASKKYGQDAIDKFVEQVARGESLTKGMPAFTLRERFMNRKGERMQADYALACIIKAMNGFVTGAQVRALGLRENEEFPSLV